MKVPFGIAQTGKAFRNEIVARQFIFRMREFEQMEMQFFVRPGTEMQWYSYWKQARMRWHEQLGMGTDAYRYHDHLKLAHYANAACDIEFASLLALRNWRAFTQELILIWVAMSATAERNYGILTRKRMNPMCPM